MSVADIPDHRLTAGGTWKHRSSNNRVKVLKVFVPSSGVFKGSLLVQISIGEGRISRCLADDFLQRYEPVVSGVKNEIVCI